MNLTLNTYKEMELKTAIEILEYHQEWRQGKRQDMIHEPKKLTEALDVLLALAKKLEEKCNLNNLLELGNVEKWFWKMDYCKRNGLPPAQSWAWDKAEEALKLELTKTNKDERH